MVSQANKWSSWFVLLVLCFLWFGKQAQSDEGNNMGWARRFKILFLNLNARMTGLEEKFRFLQTSSTKTAKRTAKSRRLAEDASKKSEDASLIAKKVDKKADIMWKVVYEAKARTKIAETEAATAKLRAQKAIERLRSLQELMDSQQRELQALNKKFVALDRRTRKLKESLKKEVLILTRKAGTRKLYNVNGIEFAVRWIPAGSFLMGSSEEELARDSDEGPRRIVSFSHGFWIMETEVTQALYKALMGVNPSKFDECGKSCPVERVSWEEAREFANKLSEKQGWEHCADIKKKRLNCKGWRLPTEAEWEYAARTGNTTVQYGGVSNVAWYFDNSASKTHPVGSKIANAWGLKDMLGNVYEWCYDSYNEKGYAILGRQDPVFTAPRAPRVFRGGSWDDSSAFVRAAYRGRAPQSKRDAKIGFRLLRR